MNANLSIFLNISRWLSAFLVVIHHVRHLILVEFTAVEQKTIVTKILYFFTGLGHEAVVIFFVISGFLVGGLTWEKWCNVGPNITKYAIARTSRIYTVLIPALFFGLGLDLIGMHWFNASKLYTDSAQYHTISLNTIISSATNATTFSGNLFMLQGILVNHLGSNGPLWSLANEWWYYCIFAFAGAAITGSGYKRITFAVLAILISILLPIKIVLWSTIWILGIIAQAWIKSRKLLPHPALGIFILLLALIIPRLSGFKESFNGTILSELIRDLTLGIAYVGALASIGKMEINITLARQHEWLSQFSFTTYLFHFPAMVFIVAVFYQIFGLAFQVQPSPSSLLYIFGVILGIYCYSYFFYLMTERHTNFVRKTITSIAYKYFYIDRFRTPQDHGSDTPGRETSET